MYGRVRLPLLLQGWSIEAFIGFDGQVQTLTFGARICGNLSPFCRLWIVSTGPQAGVTRACTRLGVLVCTCIVQLCQLSIMYLVNLEV